MGKINKDQLLEIANSLHAPAEITAHIAAASTDAEIVLLTRGVLAFAGQQLANIAAALEARGQKRQAAQAKAQGRSALEQWDRN